MLIIPITLDKFGLGLIKSTIRELRIANDGTGTKTWGNYIGRFYGSTGKLYKWVRIERHNRNEPVWRLVNRIIAKAYPNEKWAK